jgi:hypothetical protein
VNVRQGQGTGRGGGSAPVVVQVNPGGGGLLSGSQLSAQDVRAMRARIQDLRELLQDAAERRNSVAGHLRDADPSARPGYEARLGALDTRILSIENEITAINERMSTAPSSALAGASVPGFVQNPAMNFDPEAMIPIVAILSVFVFLPLSIGLSRFLWKRATNPPRAAFAADSGVNQRLEQLQQAVDTIAIEVERISEGQRFVTKLLNEKALGSGAAEPVQASRKSALPVDAG